MIVEIRTREQFILPRGAEDESRIFCVCSWIVGYAGAVWERDWLYEMTTTQPTFLVAASAGWMLL